MINSQKREKRTRTTGDTEFNKNINTLSITLIFIIVLLFLFNATVYLNFFSKIRKKIFSDFIMTEYGLYNCGIIM